MVHRNRHRRHTNVRRSSFRLPGELDYPGEPFDIDLGVVLACITHGQRISLSCPNCHTVALAIAGASTTCDDADGTVTRSENVVSPPQERGADSDHSEAPGEDQCQVYRT